MSKGSLYERLGGEGKIRQVVTSIYDNHANNKTVSARFAKSDKNQLIQHITAFVCAGTGGPQTYAGKDMISAHKGMNIGGQEYLAVIDDIMGALNAHGVGKREQEEFLMIAYSLKGDILHD
jgi:hemoglobin